MSYDGIKSSDAKRARLLELLPSFGWSIVNAGIAAGYSKTYANTTLARSIKKDARFCQAILDKRRSFEATSTDLREDVVRRLSETIRKPDLRPVELARLSEVLGRINGWMSETRILETSERQKTLQAAEQEAAKQLALSSLSDGESTDLPDPGIIGLDNRSNGPEALSDATFEPISTDSGLDSQDNGDQTATKDDANDAEAQEQEPSDQTLDGAAEGENDL